MDESHSATSALKAQEVALEQEADKLAEYFESLDETIVTHFDKYRSWVNTTEERVTDKARLIRIQLIKRQHAFEAQTTISHRFHQRLSSLKPRLNTELYGVQLPLLVLREITPCAKPGIVRHPQLRVLIDLPQPGTQTQAQALAEQAFPAMYPIPVLMPLARLRHLLEDLKQPTPSASTNGEVGGANTVAIVSSVRLNNPRGVSVHPTTGQIYVCNYSDHQIHILEPQTLALQRKVGVKGPKEGELSAPTDVIVYAAADKLLVTEEENHRVQAFHLETMESLDVSGGHGSDDASFSSPWFADLYVNPSAQDDAILFVSDRANRRVRALSVNPTFAYLRNIGVPDEPSALVVAPHGRHCRHLHEAGHNHQHTFYVLGCGGSVVREYTLDGSLVKEYPIAQTASGYVNTLTHGPEDSFLLADFENSRIRLYAHDFTLITEFPWSKPVGMAFDADGNFIVVNRKDGHVVKYRYEA